VGTSMGLRNPLPDLLPIPWVSLGKHPGKPMCTGFPFRVVWENACDQDPIGFAFTSD